MVIVLPSEPWTLKGVCQVSAAASATYSPATMKVREGRTELKGNKATYTPED